MVCLSKGKVFLCNRDLFSNSNTSLDPDICSYLSNSYPRNHTYRIRGVSITPTRKLAKRYKVLSRLYPGNLTSLLDLSACKGYFVFDAATRPTCTRSVGIDVYEPDLAVCRHVKDYLRADRVKFMNLKLHELACQIDKFGGPFQVILLINLYQYLYFGSDRDSSRYLNHDEIFRQISNICSNRVIFNNRTELSDCQNREQIEQAGIAAEKYSTEAIYSAAARYFEVSVVGTYGKFPLWVLTKR